MRINEDFIDKIENDDIEVSTSTDSDERVTTYDLYDTKFLFVVNKDFLNLDTEEYIIQLNKFYDKLFKNFDSMNFIKGYDNVRNVKTVNYYHQGEVFEKTINGINFFGMRSDCVNACKYNSWFNFKLTFDAKTESVSDIVKLLYGLFVSLRNASMFAFGKLSYRDNVVTVTYQRLKDGEPFGKYHAEGCAQLYSNEKDWKILQAIRLGDLTTLDINLRVKAEDKVLNMYTAFYPAMNDAELYASRIKVREFLKSISSSRK